VVYQVNGSRVEWNPSPARSRELTEEMPNASVTEFGNVNVKARVDSRSTRSTYLVDDSTNSRGQTITRAEYVTIPISSATVQGIVEDTIEWTEDPDFGYEIAEKIPAWTTSRSSSPVGSTSGRDAPRNTTPWWPGSGGSGRSSSAPSPAWTSP
jgi:hypothetical protein